MIFPTLYEIEVIGTWDAGVPNKERIALHVREDLNLGAYCLVCGPSMGEAHLLTSNGHFFMFPAIDIEAGSWVVLYTGAGERRVSTMKDSGDPVLVLHWGQPTVVFGRPGWTAAVLAICGIRVAGQEDAV